MASNTVPKWWEFVLCQCGPATPAGACRLMSSTEAERLAARAARLAFRLGHYLGPESAAMLVARMLVKARLGVIRNRPPLPRTRF